MSEFTREQVRHLLSAVEEGVQELTAWRREAYEKAGVFADACIEVLVSRYGADRNSINRRLFTESAFTKQYYGIPLPDPSDEVVYAIEVYRAKSLGL